MRTLILAIITTAAGCYSQSEPLNTSNDNVVILGSVSALDISGALYCESTPHPSFSQICLSVDTSNPPVYTITRDDCTETGYLANSTNPSLTLVQYEIAGCIGGTSKVYLATAVFTDGGLDITIDDTGATIELEQVH